MSAETGTVSFFNAERGYGFIRPDRPGDDLWVGLTTLDQAGIDVLWVGQRVRFRAVPSHGVGKRMAQDIDLLERGG